MTVLQGRRHTLFSLALVFLVNCANAGTLQNWISSTKTFKHPEVSVAGGVDWYNTHNTHITVSPFETDSDKVRQSAAQGSWKVGLGYSLFDDTWPHLKRLLLNLNLYQTSTTLSGTVWQYEQPQFNNYNFRVPIKSTRLMLDVKPSFFTWQSMKPYAIFGVGVAWNSVSYRETATADVNSDSRLLLSKQTTSDLAWDLGLGCNMALTDNLSVSLEYIYAALGYGSPAHEASNVHLEATPKFLLQSQSVLLGLNWRL